MRYKMMAALAATTVGIGVMATPASASLVYDSSLNVAAQGFGTAPRTLTIQGTGNKTVEGGCVGVTSTGAINVGGTGSCMGVDAAIDPNGFINSLHDETPPLTDNQKFGIPTLGELGITDASQIGILFNVTDPGGNGVTLNDLTLKFYTAAGVLIGSIDTRTAGVGNGTIFSTTDIGNGAAGFIFTVQGANELAYVNNIIAMSGSSTFRTALEATVTGVAGGPESFATINLGRPGAVPEPGTWALMLAGFGGMAIALRRSRRRRPAGNMMQVA